MSNLKQRNPIKDSSTQRPEGDSEFAEDVNLLETGACGAVVHGLEDEFEQVRRASIGSFFRSLQKCVEIAYYFWGTDSIRDISLRSDIFALQACEFLIDMLNDEIDNVRINALVSLKQVAERIHVKLTEEQLHIILSLLEDSLPLIRTATQQLLW